MAEPSRTPNAATILDYEVLYEAERRRSGIYGAALDDIIDLAPDEPDHAHGDGGYEAGQIAREARRDG